MTPREILEQVKARIIAHPETYNQNSFCGTECCIAGHIDVIINGLEAHNARGSDGSWMKMVEDIEQVALEAIKEPSPKTWLFGQAEPDEEDNYEDDPDYWPLDLSQEYYEAETTLERSKVACKAIDRYLEERGL